MRWVGYDAEKDLSAEEAKKEENARISEADEHLRGKESNCSAQKKGQEEANRVKWREVFLRKSSEIERVFQEGERRYFRWAWVSIFRTESQISRLAVVVSRQKGKAVKRNQFRRKVKWWFFQNVDCIEGGCDVILVLSDTVEKVIESGLPKRLEHLFRRVGLWKC